MLFAVFASLILSSTNHQAQLQDFFKPASSDWIIFIWVIIEVLIDGSKNIE